MNEQSTRTTEGQPCCFAIYLLGGEPCERTAVAERHGLHFCEVRGRETEVARRLDLGIHMGSPRSRAMLKGSTRRQGASRGGPVR